MATVLRRNRKISDREVIRLNSVGYSLAGIGKTFGCDPSAVSFRLKALGTPPADTRRSFMEDVFSSLPADHQEAVADLLETNPTMTIKDYVRGLIMEEVSARRHNQIGLPVAA